MKTTPQQRAALAPVASSRGPWSWRSVFLVLLLVTLVLNVGLALLSTTAEAPLTPRVEQSQQVLLAAAAAENRVVVATVANQLLLLEAGQTLATYQLSDLIGGLAVAPAGAVAVGTSTGAVVTLSPELEPQAETTVQRRVLALQTDTEGRVVVASGIGASRDRFFVAVFDAGAATPRYETKVGAPIADIVVLNDLVIYGTGTARVGAIDATGTVLWSAILKRPIKRLLALPETNQVLVGDDSGTLTLLDHTGATVWATSASQYPLRALGYDHATSLFFAGDTQGDLAAINAAGVRVWTQKAAAAAIETFLPTENGLIVVPRDGQWQTISPAALTGASQAQTWRAVWLGINVLLLLGLIASGVMSVERWRLAMPGLLKRIYRGRLSYLLMFPSVALILVFSYYPTLLAFYLSFTNASLQTITRFVGVQNYIEILTKDFYFRVGFGNLLLIVITSVIKAIVMPLLAAELVFRLRHEPMRYLFRTLFVLPAVVPGLIGVLLWRMVYDPNVGMLNQFLSAVGLDEWQRAWLGDEQTALWAIIMAGFPFIGAFPFLIYLGGLLNINPELYDAASMDGANSWARFWRIDVPLLAPQTSLVFFFAFLGGIQGFAQVLIFTRGGPGYVTYVPALQMYLRIADGQFGYASAIGVILCAVVAVGVFFNQRYQRRQADF